MSAMGHERQIQVFTSDEGLEVHIDGGRVSIFKPNWMGPEPPHSVTLWARELAWLTTTLIRHAPDADFPKETS